MNSNSIKGYRVLASPHDVAQFFMFLVFDKRINLHPDDRISDYIDEYGNPTFATEESECYQKMMDTSFDICECVGVDIYTICAKVLALFYTCDNNPEMRNLCELMD